MPMTDTEIKTTIKEEVELSKSKNSLGSFIAKALEERVSDPFWRSYIFFFLTFNWQAIITLFIANSDKIKSKVELVSCILKETSIPFTSCTIGGYAYLIIPAIFTIVFMVYLWLLKPSINGLFTYFKDKAKKKEEENKDKYRDKYNTLMNKKNLLDAEWRHEYKALQEYLRYLNKNYKTFTDQDFETYRISKDKLEQNKVFENINGKDFKIIYIYEIEGEKKYLIDITDNN